MRDDWKFIYELKPFIEGYPEFQSKHAVAWQVYLSASHMLSCKWNSEVDQATVDVWSNSFPAGPGQGILRDNQHPESYGCQHDCVINLKRLPEALQTIWTVGSTLGYVKCRRQIWLPLTHSGTYCGVVNGQTFNEDTYL